MTSRTDSRTRILILTLLMCALFIPLNGEDILIMIQVSPNVLNLQNNGQVVTIHTDIAYSVVDGSSVSLNGVEISSWKADNRGDFVAKFLMDEIKDLPSLKIDELNMLQLEGFTKDGDSFFGSQEILVINVIPKGKN